MTKFIKLKGKLINVDSISIIESETLIDIPECDTQTVLIIRLNSNDSLSRSYAGIDSKADVKKDLSKIEKFLMRDYEDQQLLDLDAA